MSHKSRKPAKQTPLRIPGFPVEFGALEPMAAVPHPILWPMAGFALGIAIGDADWIPSAWGRYWAVIPVLILIAMIVLRPVWRRRWVGMTLLLLSFVGLGQIRYEQATALPRDHIAHWIQDDATLARIVGEVASRPVVQDPQRRNPFIPRPPFAKTTFLLETRGVIVDGETLPMSGKVRVSLRSDDVDLAQGDIIQLTGRLFRQRTPSNTGETDWRRVFALQGIHAGMSVRGGEYVKVLSRNESVWRSFVSKVQSRIRSIWDVGSNQQSSRVLDVLVLGQRSAAGHRINDLFIQTGTVHYLAVSGFHVGLLAFGVWLIAKRFMKKRSAAVVVMIVLVFYAIVVEPNAPVIRATIMGIFFCLCIVFRRPVAVINWWALAALVLLLANPLELFRPGFQLSFIQVFVILTVVPMIWRGWGNWLRRDEELERANWEVGTFPKLLLRWVSRWTAGLAMVSVVLWLWAIPLAIFHFGQFAPLGSVNSVLLAPVVVFVETVGLLAALLALVFGDMGGALASSLDGVAGILVGWVEKIAVMTPALVTAKSPPAWLIVATYASILLPLHWVRSRPIWFGMRAAASVWLSRLFVILSFVVVVGLWMGWLCLPTASQRDAAEFHFFSVGDGMAAAMIDTNKNATVFDVGTISDFDVGTTMVDALQSLNVESVKSAWISHANFDHYSGLMTLCDRTDLSKVYASPHFFDATREMPTMRPLKTALDNKEIEQSAMLADDGTVSSEMVLRVLWPARGLKPTEWDANDRSLVLMVECFGRRRVLLTGDIEKQAMLALLARHERGEISLKADVLVSPHHGSVIRNVTRDFVAAVNPEVVIVSAYKRRLKCESIIAEAAGESCRVLTTGDVGEIVVRILPDGAIKIVTPFAKREIGCRKS